MWCVKRRSLLGLGGQTVVLVRETLQHKGYCRAKCVSFEREKEKEDDQVPRTEARAEHDTFTDVSLRLRWRGRRMSLCQSKATPPGAPFSCGSCRRPRAILRRFLSSIEQTSRQPGVPDAEVRHGPRAKMHDPRTQAINDPCQNLR